MGCAVEHGAQVFDGRDLVAGEAVRLGHHAFGQGRFRHFGPHFRQIVMKSVCHAAENRYGRSMEDALKSLGWSKAELARRLGVRPGTVTDWAGNPPQYALAYLAMALELKAVRDRAGEALEKTK